MYSRIQTDDKARSALELSFPYEKFDIVWAEHNQMNIKDKRKFYGEMSRVFDPCLD
jgi:ubiquinone/menaquinone biosynthesis C-methylase UbiE